MEENRAKVTKKKIERQMNTRRQSVPCMMNAQTKLFDKRNVQSLFTVGKSILNIFYTESLFKCIERARQ